MRQMPDFIVAGKRWDVVPMASQTGRSSEDHYTEVYLSAICCSGWVVEEEEVLASCYLCFPELAQLRRQ